MAPTLRAALPRPPPSPAGRADWLPAVALAAMAVIALAPFVVVRLPSMNDLPGHIGRYHVMMNLAGSEVLQRYYTFEWHLVGNLGADLLVWITAPLIGVEQAARLVVAAIPLLSLGGIAAVSRALHGRIEPGAAIAGCFVFSSPFMWGFVNFCLATALALFAFAGWVRMRGRGPGVDPAGVHPGDLPDLARPRHGVGPARPVRRRL